MQTFFYRGDAKMLFSMNVNLDLGPIKIFLLYYINIADKWLTMTLPGFLVYFMLEPWELIGSTMELYVR
jgi:hypothetical protein